MFLFKHSVMSLAAIVLLVTIVMVPLFFKNSTSQETAGNKWFHGDMCSKSDYISWGIIKLE